MMLRLETRGYFADEIEELKTENNRTRRIVEIFDDHAFCFRTPTNRYSFFLPLDAVKEDKPKKKYRPFKTINELKKSLNKVNRSAHQFMCVGNDIFIRNINKNQITHLIITMIDRDAETNEVLFVNGMSPIHLFNNYEIRVGAEWLPFGVEVEND